MSKNVNHCTIDVKSSNMCSTTDNLNTKYSEDVKLINDFIPCTSNTPSTSVVNNCTDRGSCNMGDGSYQKWLTNLK